YAIFQWHGNIICRPITHSFRVSYGASLAGLPQQRRSATQCWRVSSAVARLASQKVIYMPEVVLPRGRYRSQSQSFRRTLLNRCSKELRIFKLQAYSGLNRIDVDFSFGPEFCHVFRRFRCHLGAALAADERGWTCDRGGIFLQIDELVR